MKLRTIGRWSKIEARSASTGVVIALARSLVVGPMVVSIGLLATWVSPCLAQENSVLIEADERPLHGVESATVDLFEQMCRDDGFGGIDPLPQAALDELNEYIEKIGRIRSPGCSRAGTVDELFMEECYGECPEPVTVSALSSLVSVSTIVVHGTVGDIVPAYDFHRNRAASIVFLDVLRSFPSAALGDAERIAFVLPEGAFYCRGVLVCSSPDGGTAGASPPVKHGQELLVGGWSFNPRDRSLRAMEAVIFVVGRDGVAKPLKSADAYSPETFALSTALATLGREFR